MIAIHPTNERRVLDKNGTLLNAGLMLGQRQRR